MSQKEHKEFECKQKEFRRERGEKRWKTWHDFKEDMGFITEKEIFRKG